MTDARSGAVVMTLAMAQLPMRVGDVAGNADMVVTAALDARDRLGADGIVFPELTLTGYPPEDLLFRPDFLGQVEQAVDRVRTAVSGITVVFGFPLRCGTSLFNAAAVYRDGRCLGRYHKHHLANHGVFDDRRYFDSGSGSLVFDLAGSRCAVTICEDLWHAGPYERAVADGAELVINLNASPFHGGKAVERSAVIRARQQSRPVPVVYVNLVGGQDEVVYDGGSCAVTAAGDLAVRAPSFQDGLYPVAFERVGGTLAPVPGRIAEDPDEPGNTYAALVRGTRDYLRASGFQRAVLGLSGGIDSAVVAAIAVDALGADRVHAVMLPSRYTSRESLEDAEACAGLLGIRYSTLSIEPPFQSARAVLEDLFSGLDEDVTEENLQSRCRGLLLMALSNKFGSMVLTTGNKSEYAVGYATLYGDMCGGFAPIKDVYKTSVFALARWRNGVSRVIPERILTKAPTAELRADQKDEDSLPPYPVLDRILQGYVENDLGVEQLVAAGEDPATVERVVQLLHRSEYKRRQSAPGVKVTRKAFGRERRYPIMSGFRPS